MVAEIKVIGIRKFLRRGFAGLLYSKDGELLRVGYGHGAKEEAVDDAEDGGVDGDAEGEGDDGEGGEPGRLA